MRIIKLVEYELKTQWRIFLIFFVVVFFLILPSVSALILVGELPGKIEQMSEDTGLTELWVFADTTEDLDWLKGQNVSFYQSQKPDEYAFFLLDHEREGGTEYQAGAEMLFYPFEGKNMIAELMTDHLVQGNPPSATASAEDKDKIWLREEDAKRLGYGLGDSVRLCTEKSECILEVAGIYYDDFSFTEAYISGDSFLNHYETESVACRIKTEDVRSCVKMIRSLRSRYIRYDGKTNLLQSILAVDYTAYLIMGLLLILLCGLTYDLMYFYFQKRKYYYAILKTQGLSNRWFFGINYGLFFLLYTCSFSFSLLFAPAYLKKIEEKFDLFLPELGLKLSIWNKETIMYYFILLILICMICIPVTVKYKDDRMSRQLNENEG